MSDFHFDPLYTPGLSSDCGEPLCCRPPNEKGEPAIAFLKNVLCSNNGSWGGFDLAIWQSENLLCNDVN